jgi:hypothetical protein
MAGNNKKNYKININHLLDEMNDKNQVLKHLLTKIEQLDLLDGFVIRLLKFSYITTIQTAIFSSEFTTDCKVKLFHLLNEFEVLQKKRR